jgi:hypothetical protein
MRYSRLWLAATIIALVVFGGFVLSVPHTKDVDTGLSLESVATSVPIVTVRDSFKKGLHTITGSLEAPNACASVTAEATYSGDTPDTEGILVALSLPEDSGVCLQVPTRVSFTATVSAPARLPITVTVNGTAATTTTS